MAHALDDGVRSVEVNISAAEMRDLFPNCDIRTLAKDWVMTIEDLSEIAEEWAGYFQVCITTKRLLLYPYANGTAALLAGHTGDAPLARIIVTGVTLKIDFEI